MKQVSLSGVLILLLLVFFVVGVAWNAVTVHVYILPRYSFLWMLLAGLIVLFSLAPAILLIGSALHAENVPASGTFHDVAAKELIPAFIFALVLSIGYILIIPEVENKKSWYEQTSATFNNAIKAAQKAYAGKNYVETQRLLLIARNIDARNPEYTKLYDSVMLTIQSQMQAKETDSSIQEPDKGQEQGANSLYIAALQAKDAGHYLDAHYLARRALALNPERKEIQTLINETWKLMNMQKPDPKKTEEAELFAKKVKGYEFYDSGRYLEAYQVFLALSQKYADDTDVKLFLARSVEQLRKVAFFIEEDNLAFSLTAPVPYAVGLSTDKTVFRLSAESAAFSYQGVFFRNLKLQVEKPEVISLEAPFARLKDNTLTLRAVDRTNPLVHQDPTWNTTRPKVDGVLLDFPLSETQALLLFLIFQKPKNIPSYKLWESMKTAELYHIDTKELYLEASRRFAYPFLLLMVIMFGIGLGLRFRSEQTDSFFMQFISSCLLVPAIIYPMGIMTNIGFSMARLIGHYTKGFVFLLSWCGFLLFVSFLVIFISAKISSLFVRRRGL